MTLLSVPRARTSLGQQLCQLPHGFVDFHLVERVTFKCLPHCLCTGENWSGATVIATRPSAAPYLSCLTLPTCEQTENKMVTRSPAWINGLRHSGDVAPLRSKRWTRTVPTLAAVSAPAFGAENALFN